MAKFLTIVGVAGLLNTGIVWTVNQFDHSARSDCPGQIVCPVTGEPVCVDRCPVDPRNNRDQPAATPSCCR